MAYVERDFKSKKEFKESVARGEKNFVYSPGPFPPNKNGVEHIEGPHYPKPHRWYATVQVKDGVVISVK